MPQQTVVSSAMQLTTEMVEGATWNAMQHPELKSKRVKRDITYVQMGLD